MASKMNPYDEEKSMSLTIHRIVCYVVLSIFAILALLFVYLLFINATRSHNAIQTSLSFLPGGSLINNFNKVMADENIQILRGLLNSLIIAGLSAIFSIYFSGMTAYGIHVYNFKGKNALFTFILIIMTIPTQISALGFYNQMTSWGLLNNYIPLVVPSIAAPSVFFFMKQYMDGSLPLEIVEAARMDGSNEFRTYNQIILPILKPAFAVQAIFAFTSSWNNYFLPALILDKADMKTMPLWIAYVRGREAAHNDFGEVYMVLALAILPVMIVYFCFSKFIVAGVTLGAVKG
ncbi:MAG: carbohydrate ABC transporter permease [Bacteroides sp.]|nr:carbohydrate ABC transporter permease [Eubacterium sp.]MCM1418449.1 carbohydrate ABC transporter permease [Roseburia sp.]MCM1462045.1 carbohydrate ABC transporter permease [Bacteroides sp.]